LSEKLEGADLPRVIAIVGPTASGKSDLALTWAQQLSGEIVSADSVQIYRHFDIGSGKPSREELARAPHHLLSEIEPHAEMDASLFAATALERIARIVERGRTPIICGGTFLWTKALVYGLVPAPPKDEAIRERHRQLALEQGRRALHEQLLSVDPVCHARLNPNDLVRVSRALEVYELTGKPLSQLQREHAFSQPRVDARLFGVVHPREQLHLRILRRAERMFAAGWVEEVRALMAAGFGATRPMASVGYREIAAAISDGATIDDVSLIDDVARVTRIFARRQLTWLREQPVTWLPAEQLTPSAQAPAELRSWLGVRS
jgi:tRNA dimethylallyltransferase